MKFKIIKQPQIRYNIGFDYVISNFYTSNFLAYFNGKKWVVDMEEEGWYTDIQHIKSLRALKRHIRKGHLCPGEYILKSKYFNCDVYLKIYLTKK